MNLLGIANRKILIVLLVALLIALSLRVVAPSIVLWYVNKTIAETQGITGKVEDIDLALFRGAYVIEGIDIQQQKADASSPFIHIHKVDLSILWSALFEGHLVSEIVLHSPTISLSDSRDQSVIESDEVLQETTWIGLAKDLVPLSIDRLEIIDGKMSFAANFAEEQSEFIVSNITLLARNIAIRQNSDQVGDLFIGGSIQGQTPFKLTATFNPNKNKPTFDMNLEVAKLPVKAVEPMMKIYAPFDFEAGEIDMASELLAEQGKIDGYIKVGVYNLDIFSWHEDVIEDNDNPLELIVEALGGFISSLFENQNRDLIATKIPINGDFSEPDLSIVEAILGIIRNAFVEAYKLDVEHSVPAKSPKPEEVSEPAG
jgi:hypothetical protein